MAQYIGQKKILGVEDEGERVTIRYADGSISDMSKVMFDASVSNRQEDASTLRSRSLQPLAVELLEVILKWDVKLEDIEYVLVLVRTSLEENVKAAVEAVWGEKIHDRTVGQADRILKQYAKKEDTKENDDE